MPDCDSPLHPRARDGLALFNVGEFFEAHEALEEAWRDTPEPIRDLYRGILQIAVAYLHLERQNYDGVLKMIERSHKWLADWPETCRGIQIGQLRRDAATVAAAVRDLGPDNLAAFDRSLLKKVDYDPQP